MNEQQQKNKGPESLLEAWMKSSTEFWGSMASKWPGASGTASSKRGDPVRVQESMDSALRMWQALSSSLSDEGTWDSLLRGINSFPEILTKMIQTGWDRYFQMQQQWMEKTGKIEKRAEAYKFEDVDQDAFKAWNEIYEEEFRKFFYAPQLGLMRVYQERAGRFTDKSNLFQGAIAEFMHLLYLPMEKSFNAMQEKLEDLAKEELPENPKDYYQMWLKILEGHYMTLFKSQEYTQALGKTLGSMEEFTMARQELLQDALQSLPVATDKDMDELYKELYELKKRIKQLEKKA